LGEGEMGWEREGGGSKEVRGDRKGYMHTAHGAVEVDGSDEDGELAE
jgi:hypothetical protein